MEWQRPRQQQLPLQRLSRKPPGNVPSPGCDLQYDQTLPDGVAAVEHGSTDGDGSVAAADVVDVAADDEAVAAVSGVTSDGVGGTFHFQALGHPSGGNGCSCGRNVYWPCCHQRGSEGAATAATAAAAGEDFAVAAGGVDLGNDGPMRIGRPGWANLP